MIGFPVLFFIPDVAPVAWMLVLISGILEAVYFITLTRAYRDGDLSVVYPIARGSAPLFLLLWAIIFLSERPTVVGLFGILAVVAGLYVINLRSFSDWRRPLQGFQSPASRWAIVTGLLISTYSAVDKLGIRHFPPFTYLYLILLVCWICLSYQWLLSDRRTPLVDEIRSAKKFWYVLSAAISGTAAYALVLAALRISPVSYVAPVREVSVVIGAWIGVRFLNEQSGSMRIFASILIAAGISLIAFGG